MLYEKMLSESRLLEAQIQAIHARLRSLPEGKLICARNGSRWKWYLSNGSHSTYLPKSKRELAQQLAIKKYLSAQLNDLLLEKKAIDCYLQKYSPHIRQSDILLSSDSEYSHLLSPYFTPLSQELADWMCSSYEHNNIYPEQLIHKTSSGNLVRSKSEAIIDMVLHQNKIPFRYECALHLGETTIFPDFTIRHPNTGNLFYWEHFGMMDNPTYSKNAWNKLQLYSLNNIIPSIHLITTFETKEQPLSTELVEKIITYYFL